MNKPTRINDDYHIIYKPYVGFGWIWRVLNLLTSFFQAKLCRPSKARLLVPHGWLGCTWSCCHSRWVHPSHRSSRHAWSGRARCRTSDSSRRRPHTNGGGSLQLKVLKSYLLQGSAVLLLCKRHEMACSRLVTMCCIILSSLKWPMGQPKRLWSGSLRIPPQVPQVCILLACTGHCQFQWSKSAGCWQLGQIERSSLYLLFEESIKRSLWMTLMGEI